LVDGKPSRSIEGLPIKPVEVRREKPMRNRMAEFDHIRLCHRQEPTLTPPASIVRRRSLLPLTAIRLYRPRPCADLAMPITDTAFMVHGFEPFPQIARR